MEPLPLPEVVATGSAAPPAVGYTLAVVVGVLFFLFGLLLLIFVVLPMIPAKRVRGMKLFFEPENLHLGFDSSFVERFIDAYAVTMPDAYAAIGSPTSAEQIKKLASQISCRFKKGYLTSPEREKLGLDLNNDGKKDKLTGLAYSARNIAVAVPDNMDVERTAFSYEVHNAIMQGIAGYAVAIGESFVDPKDERLLPFLGGKKLSDMKSKRAVLDAAYEKIKHAPKST